MLYHLTVSYIIIYYFMLYQRVLNYIASYSTIRYNVIHYDIISYHTYDTIYISWSSRHLAPLTLCTMPSGFFDGALQHIRYVMI